MLTTCPVGFHYLPYRLDETPPSDVPNVSKSVTIFKQFKETIKDHNTIYETLYLFTFSIENGSFWNTKQPFFS